MTQCQERVRKREAGAKEVVLQAQKELARWSAEVVEGEQIGDTSSRVGAPPASSRSSRHVSRGGEVVEGKGRWSSRSRDPSPGPLFRSQFRSSSGGAEGTVRVELMDMQKERDALKAALEAQRNCMDTSGPTSPGTRMSVLIDDAPKRRCLERS